MTDVEPSGFDVSEAEAVGPSKGLLLMNTFTLCILCQAQVCYPLKILTSL